MSGMRRLQREGLSKQAAFNRMKAAASLNFLNVGHTYLPKKRPYLSQK